MSRKQAASLFRLWSRTIVVLGGLAVGLAACSSLTEYADPSKFFMSVAATVGGWFGYDEEDGKSGSVSDGAASEGAARDGFPLLSSVPERPLPPSTADERERMEARLLADSSEAAGLNKPGAVTADRTSPLWPNVPPPALPDAPVDIRGSAAAQDAAPDTEPLALTKATEAVVIQPMVESAPPGAVPREAAIAPGPDAASAEDGAANAAPTAGTRQPGGSAALQGAQAETSSSLPPSILSTSGSGAVSRPEVARKFDLRPALAGATATPIPLAMPVEALPRLDLFGGPAVSTADGVVNFAHGSAQLSVEGQEVVRALSRRVLESDFTLRIIAHSSMRTRELDPAVHSMTNFVMSVQRANAVVTAFRDNGVPAERIIVDALGDSSPRFSEAMPSGEIGNRRAEIFIEG